MSWDDLNPSSALISDTVNVPMQVLVVAATGLIRDEIADSFDDEFEVTSVADAWSAAEVAARSPHVLVVVADDVVNCSPEELIQRVRLSTADGSRLPVLWLGAHGEPQDLLAASQAGADDVGRWPIEPDMMRARVRSLCRVARLESSMEHAAESPDLSFPDLLCALSASTHLINNAVAGISGRAQLAALAGLTDDTGLVPVCLMESRKLSLVLGALHRLSEAFSATLPREEDPVVLSTGERR